MDVAPFDRVLRRIPAIGVGTLAGDQIEMAGLGTIGDALDPGALRWEIGSITKVFTGILLAEMSVRGEVGLDDPIGRFAPAEVANRLPASDHQPTLTDLATHTAGLPRIPLAWMRRIRGSGDPYALLTEDDVWDVLGPKMARPRKQKMRYSNYGVGLLGHLLARAAGTTYEALVAERILAPLGMTATSAGGADPMPGFRKKRPTPPWNFGALAGAGALRSTLPDMLTFATACIDPPSGTLGAALDLAREPVCRGRFGISGMGLGWHVRPTPPRRLRGTVWHNGGTYGGASFVAVNPTLRVAAVTFGNAGPRVMSPLDGPSWRLFDQLT
ncbi:MAG: serine hydrolase domain-containing protein [Actinomycetota bacterium]